MHNIRTIIRAATQNLTTSRAISLISTIHKPRSDPRRLWADLTDSDQSDSDNPCGNSYSVRQKFINRNATLATNSATQPNHAAVGKAGNSAFGKRAKMHGSISNASNGGYNSSTSIGSYTTSLHLKRQQRSRKDKVPSSTPSRGQIEGDAGTGNDVRNTHDVHNASRFGATRTNTNNSMMSVQSAQSATDTDTDKVLTDATTGSGKKARKLRQKENKNKNKNEKLEKKGAKQESRVRVKEELDDADKAVNDAGVEVETTEKDLEAAVVTALQIAKIDEEKGAEINTGTDAMLVLNSTSAGNNCNVNNDVDNSVSTDKSSIIIEEKEDDEENEEGVSLLYRPPSPLFLLDDPVVLGMEKFLMNRWTMVEDLVINGYAM